MSPLHPLDFITTTTITATITITTQQNHQAKEVATVSGASMTTTAMLFCVLFLCTMMQTRASGRITLRPTVPLKGDELIVTYGYCRKNTGLSRCVDNPLPLPLKKKNSKLWCPYHVCGPSFVSTRKCGAFPATHWCRIESRRTIGYYCRKSNTHRTWKWPKPCVGKCKKMRTCLCRRNRKRRSTFWPLRRVPKSMCEA